LSRAVSNRLSANSDSNFSLAVCEAPKRAAYVTGTCSTCGITDVLSKASVLGTAGTIPPVDRVESLPVLYFLGNFWVAFIQHFDILDDRIASS
jgi:hypothetical protein